MKNIIFDLDGTLIDSAPSILSCIYQALNDHNISLDKKLGVDLIGPPLNLTLEKILGPTNISLVPSVIDSFINIYDEEGFRSSAPYSGINELLKSLKQAKINTYIATNKRIEPTKKIITNLGWSDYFLGVYGINTKKSTDGKFIDKSDTLFHLLKNFQLEASESIYVGDRIEDQLAAQDNDLQSVTVKWGYGDYSVKSLYLNLIENPADLYLLINENE
jgi:phosphoglycolate phosphatase